MLVIRDTTVYTPDGILEHGAVRIDAGRITVVTADAGAGAADQQIDGRGLSLVPGLIDLQCNGLCGHDMLDGRPEVVRALAAVLPRFGCTAVLPTLVTASREMLAAGLAAIATVAERQGPGAVVLGTHMEGPWLSPAHYGAHPPAYVRPFDRHEFAALSAAARGTLRLVTLAPEAPGNEDAVAAIAATGALVSLGHSAAGYEQALAAVAAGARMVTHLFNAMDPMYHRAPGLAGAALDCKELTPGLIPDGHHVHPAVMRLVARARGSHGLAVVTDSVPAAGLPPGEYFWHERRIHFDGETVRLPSGGLAGSALTPIEALRRYMAITGFSLAEALPTMTSTPARLLGRQGERGAIVPGAHADLVLLTPDLRVHTTLVGGDVAYRAEDA